MLASAVPRKFPIPFAFLAGGAYIRDIPTPSQIPSQNGAASLTDGFPPNCFSPIGAGGTGPFGADLNGLLKQMSQWNQWQQAGGQVPYDATFQAAIGGYPQNAIIASAVIGYFWISLVDNNLSNPDTGGAGWAPYAAVGGISTGDVKWRPTSEVLPGWIIANATTIGSATSGASQRANADTANLFAWHWTNFPNSQCPVFTSGGTPTTRGANAAADFAAGKRIQVVDLRGVVMAGVDTMAGSSAQIYWPTSVVPIISGSRDTSGSLLGEPTHTLTLPELAAHNHGINDPTHAHGITDTGHGHGLTDPGHPHNGTVAQQGWAGAAGTQILTGLSYGSNNGTGTSFALSIQSNVTSITIATNTTGILINSNATGITTANNGSGQAHNTVQRSMMGFIYLKL